MFVNLQGWRDEACLKREELVVLNIWMAIEVLPFYLWSEGVFRQIGDLFRGLLEIYQKTTIFSLLYAKLSNRNWKCILQFFMFFLDGKKYKLSTRNIVGGGFTSSHATFFHGCKKVLKLGLRLQRVMVSLKCGFLKCCKLSHLKGSVRGGIRDLGQWVWKFLAQSLTQLGIMIEPDEILGRIFEIELHSFGLDYPDILLES